MRVVCTTSCGEKRFLRKLPDNIALNPGWYKCRNNRRVKIFIANYPKIIGYQELSGAVWDNTNKVFFKFGTWGGRGISIDFGSYLDLIDFSKVPSNYPEKTKEAELLRHANELQNEIFERLSSGRMNGKKNSEKLRRCGASSGQDRSVERNKKRIADRTESFMSRVLDRFGERKRISCGPQT